MLSEIHKSKIIIKERKKKTQNNMVTIKDDQYNIKGFFSLISIDHTFTEHPFLTFFVTNIVNVNNI